MAANDFSSGYSGYAPGNYSGMAQAGRSAADAVNAIPKAAKPTPEAGIHKSADSRAERSTHNPDNRLPDDETIFHKVKRGLGME